MYTFGGGTLPINLPQKIANVILLVFSKFGPGQKTHNGFTMEGVEEEYKLILGPFFSLA